jgi:hypothetical protein
MRFSVQYGVMDGGWGMGGFQKGGVRGGGGGDSMNERIRNRVEKRNGLAKRYQRGGRKCRFCSPKL